jgi:hypothetical protein
MLEFRGTTFADRPLADGPRRRSGRSQDRAQIAVAAAWRHPPHSWLTNYICPVLQHARKSPRSTALFS